MNKCKFFMNENLCKMTKKNFEKGLDIFLAMVYNNIKEKRKDLMIMFEKAIIMYRKARTATDMGNLVRFCKENGIDFFDVEECACWED